MDAAIKRYLQRSVIAYPEPLKWWAFILNATKGNYAPLLEGYTGNICQIHQKIAAELK